MSTTAHMPVEDYLRLTEKPYREYRDGVLYPKPPPTFAHGVIQAVLAAMLRALGLRAGTEVTLRISPNKCLIPDVIAAARIETPYPTEPVLLCCEILSPDDRMETTFAKCGEYHAWGVPFCWVIDPVRRAAWECHSGGEPTRVSGVLHAGDIAVNLEQLFSALDQ